GGGGVGGKPAAGGGVVEASAVVVETAVVLLLLLEVELVAKAGSHGEGAGRASDSVLAPRLVRLAMDDCRAGVRDGGGAAQMVRVVVLERAVRGALRV